MTDNTSTRHTPLSFPHGKRATRLSRALLSALLATGIPTLGMAQAAASDAQPDQVFAIAPGTLAETLRQFAAQTQVRISPLPERLARRASPGLQGAWPTQAALTQLLAGSGVQAIAQPDGSYRLRQATVTAESTQHAGDDLGAVYVVGKSRGMPAAYAGGQVARGGRLGMLGNKDFMATPFTINSYTAQLMKDQQATRASDVLLNDPSVRPLVSPFGYQDNMFVRGIRLSARDFAFDGLYGITGNRSIDLNGAERMEVLHGPAAFAFGFAPSGTIAGVVNMVPKRAGDTPATSLSIDATSRSTLGLSAETGQRFGAEKQWGLHAAGTYLNGETPIRGQHDRHGGFALGLDYRGERMRATLDLGYSNFRFREINDSLGVDPGFAIPKAPQLNRSISQHWGYAKSEAQYGATRFEYDFTPDWTAYVAAGASTVREEFFYSLPTIKDAAGRIDSTVLSSGGRETQKTAEAGVRGQFMTGTVKHSVIVSGNFYTVDYPFAGATGYAFTSNIYAPVQVPPPTGIPKRVYYDPSDTYNRSVAIADTASFAGGKFEVTAGVRQQRISQTSHSSRGPAFNTYYRKQANTPLLALLYRPSKRLSFYASYAEGLAGGPTAPSNAVNAGQMFPPVVSRQREAGVKFDSGKLGLTAAAFRIDVNSAYTDPQTHVFGILGQQRNTGIEFNTFGSPLAGLRVLGGFQWIKSDMTRTQNPALQGKEATGVPHLQAVASAEYDLPFARGLTATARATQSSSQFYDAANTQRIPAWTRWDLGARYALQLAGVRYSTRFAVENLGKSNYWQSAGSGSLTLGTPRTFKLSVGVDF